MKKFISFAATGIIAFLVAVMFFAPSAETETVYENVKADYGSCKTHNYGSGEYTYVGEATCSASATKYRTCKTCGYIEKIIVPKDPDNHSVVSDKVFYDPAPTCVSNGVQYKLCYGCNAHTEVKEVAVDFNAHSADGDYVIIKEETCSSEGEKAYKCKYCDNFFGNEKIPVNSEKHVVDDSSKWTVTKMPTCAKDGEMVGYCNACGAKAETKTIPATKKHTPSEDWTVDVQPTCSADGSKSHHCTVCDSPCDSVVIPATPGKHSFDKKYTTDKEATCVAKGSESRHCLNCEAKTDVREIAVDSDAHAYSDNWVITKQPTCSNTGLKHKVCTLCKKESVATVIEKKKHSYPKEYEVVKMSADEQSAVVKYICKKCGYEYTTVVVFTAVNGIGDMGNSELAGKYYELVPVEKTVIKVDSKKFIVSNVARNTVVDDFMAKFKNGSVFVVYDAKGYFKNETTFIGTGCRLNFETKDGLETNYTVSVTGDMDSDGKVTASDARLVLRAAARIENPEGAYFTAADVNLDEKITASDARKTLLVAANMEYFENTYEH